MWAGRWCLGVDGFETNQRPLEPHGCVMYFDAMAAQDFEEKVVMDIVNIGSIC